VIYHPGYDDENWNWATSQVQAVLEDNPMMYERCAGLDPDDFKAEFLQYPRLAEVFTAQDMGRIDWVELANFFGYEHEADVIELPQRGKTVEEVAQEVISQGVSTVEAVGRVVEAHQEAIELILNTLDSHEQRLDRMKKQIAAIVEVHGT
jgi:hypothetical protein